MYMYLQFAMYRGIFTVCLPFTANIVYGGKFTIWFTAAFTAKQLREKKVANTAPLENLFVWLSKKLGDKLSFFFRIDIAMTSAIV